MNELKAALVPGILALVGVRLATAIAPPTTMWQLAFGAAGAIGGVVLAAKL